MAENARGLLVRSAFGGSLASSDVKIVSVNAGGPAPLTVAITSPTAGASLTQNQQITISGTVSRSGTPVTVTGVGPATVVGTSWTRTYTPSSLGPATIAVVANDGSDVANASVNVTVVSGAPAVSISISSPLEAATLVPDVEITISGTVSPSGTPVVLTAIGSATVTGGTWSRTFTPTEEGPLTIQASATLNGETAYDSVSVTVDDGVAPTTRRTRRIDTFVASGTWNRPFGDFWSPAGVASRFRAEAYGAGGGGTTAIGGGGGGASAIHTSVDASATSSFAVTIGTSAADTDGGDTSIGSAVVAKGGRSGTNGGTGGAAASCTGETKYSGGNGALGAGTLSGGGGASSLASASGTTPAAPNGGGPVAGAAGRPFGAGGGSTAAAQAAGSSGLAYVEYDVEPGNYPGFRGYAATRTASGTSHALNMPAGIQAGEQLVVLAWLDGSATFTTADATEFATAVSGTTMRGAAYRRTATGSDTISITTSASAPVSAFVLRFDEAGTPEGTAVGGAAANGNPPAHIPATSGNYTVISACGWDASADGTPTLPSGGYRDFVVQGSLGANGESIAFALKEMLVDNVTGENPGGFTSVAEQFVAFTVMVPFTGEMVEDPDAELEYGSVYFDGILDQLQELNGTTVGPTAALSLATWTIEAWIKLDTFGIVGGATNYDGYPIFARGYNSENTNYFFGVRGSDLRLIATFEISGLSNRNLAGTRVLERGIWYHVAYSYDGTTSRLYVNGVEDASAAHAGPPLLTATAPSCIGTVALTGGNTSGAFHGCIRNVRVWNAARTAGQISTSATTAAALAPTSGLVGEWILDTDNFESDNAPPTILGSGSTGHTGGPTENFLGSAGPKFRQMALTNFVPDVPPFAIDTAPSVSLVAPADGASGTSTTQLQASPADYDANTNTVEFWGRRNESAPNFTIFALPDTQLLVDAYPVLLNNMFAWVMTNWDALNGKAVLSLGDCVQESNDAQWTTYGGAVSATFEVPRAGYPDGVPYLHTVGNHDQLAAGNPEGTSKANEYFGPSRFEGRDYYGGHFGADNDNNYILFDAGPLQFVAVSTEFDFEVSRTDQIAWVRSIFQAHPERIGILVSHYILTRQTPGHMTPQAEALYDAVKDLPNVKLFLSGHLGESSRTEKYNGYRIQMLMADYQFETSDTAKVRVMQFQPRDGRILVRTYNSVAGAYDQDAFSEFYVPIDFGYPDFVKLGESAGVAAGATASYNWSGLTAGKYEWFARAKNGNVYRDSERRGFTVA